MTIIYGFAAGLGLGWVFFQGLSWTVRALANSARPWLLFLLSYLARFGLMALCFIVLARLAGWQPVLSCLAGFLVARIILLR